MSQIEEIIAEQLSQHDLQMLPNGYRFEREHGVTDLTFDPVSKEDGDFGLSSIATVKTTFTKGMPPFDGDAINRLNRRAVHGNFLLANSTVESPLPPKADIHQRIEHDCFVPIADMRPHTNCMALGFRDIADSHRSELALLHEA